MDKVGHENGSNEPVKRQRATTSSKGRTSRSPSPYRSRPGQTPAEFANEFWQHTITTAEESSEDFKHQSLPLARIKKVMKSDPEVQMISSEVTILFEKACQIFIAELTLRSHVLSLSSRRRTLARVDVAGAIAKSDMFDFLIDTVPREGTAGPSPAQDVAEPDDAGPSTKSRRRTSAGKKGRKTRFLDAAEDAAYEAIPKPVKGTPKVKKLFGRNTPKPHATAASSDEPDGDSHGRFERQGHHGELEHEKEGVDEESTMETSGMGASGMGASTLGDGRFPLVSAPDGSGGALTYGAGHHGDYEMGWPLQDPFVFRQHEDQY